MIGVDPSRTGRAPRAAWLIALALAGCRAPEPVDGRFVGCPSVDVTDGGAVCVAPPGEAPELFVFLPGARALAGLEGAALRGSPRVAVDGMWLTLALAPPAPVVVDVKPRGRWRLTVQVEA
ncbi:MAG: hypothetical protein KC620_12550, partial [Myxococcales bacterium]|nr:hypothetical protein [Myxococcales bacterium]